jgi:hypothetical protein
MSIDTKEAGNMFRCIISWALKTDRDFFLRCVGESTTLALNGDSTPKDVLWCIKTIRDEEIVSTAEVVH